MTSDQSIIFMGTPEFASHSLERIIENNLNVKAVITAPDRPAGRGQKLRFSAVKETALKHNLPVLQPTNLKDEDFIQELKELEADLFVVVAFRMLPEVVWSMPAKGTINLHGSLLPNYRGAAPINWAVINGETETGVTTFFIEKEIDTGKVIHSAKTPIEKEDNAGSVHDRLMEIGAELITKTVQDIFADQIEGVPQTELMTGEEKEAPKIFKDDCKIDWNQSSEKVFNKIRGLSPYPAAFTQIRNIKTDQIKALKIFKVEQTGINSTSKEIITKENILFGCSDNYISIVELQLEGKKRMATQEFIRGFNFEDWEIV